MIKHMVVYSHSSGDHDTER